MNEVVANFFELWGWSYLGPFSQYMYKADLYVNVFFPLIIVPFVVLLIYYVIWDNIRLSKLSSWLIINLVIALIIGIVGYTIADNGLYDYFNSHHIKNPQITDSDFYWFTLICIIWTFIWEFLLSCILKFFSIKSRHIPF